MCENDSYDENNRKTRRGVRGLDRQSSWSSAVFGSSSTSTIFRFVPVRPYDTKLTEIVVTMQEARSLELILVILRPAFYLSLVHNIATCRDVEFQVEFLWKRTTIIR
jgi:hypothetical protein